MTSSDFFTVCIFGFALAVVAARLLSMWFRHLLARQIDMGPPGHLGAGHLRREQRVLAGRLGTPASTARMLSWVLRALEVVLVLGICAIFYVAFSIDDREDAGCIACLLDPTSKSPLFWMGYVLVVLWIVVPRLGQIMVLRHDPRQMEEEGRLDIRRYRMGLRMIFTDHPAPTDTIAIRLRAICRCLVLLAIVDALAAGVLLIMQR